MLVTESFICHVASLRTFALCLLISLFSSVSITFHTTREWILGMQLHYDTYLPDIWWWWTMKTSPSYMLVAAMIRKPHNSRYTLLVNIKVEMKKMIITIRTVQYNCQKNKQYQSVWWGFFFFCPTAAGILETRQLYDWN